MEYASGKNASTLHVRAREGMAGGRARLDEKKNGRAKRASAQNGREWTDEMRPRPSATIDAAGRNANNMRTYVATRNRYDLIMPSSGRSTFSRSLVHANFFRGSQCLSLLP